MTPDAGDCNHQSLFFCPIPIRPGGICCRCLFWPTDQRRNRAQGPIGLVLGVGARLSQAAGEADGPRSSHRMLQ